MGYNNNAVSHYVFTDTETTGLQPGVTAGEILSIGIVICNARTFDILEEHEWFVRPEHIETASPKALEVNGYTPEKWASAGEQSLVEIMPAVSQKLRRGEFAGHNTPFDIDFLWEAAGRLGIAGFPKRPWSNLDTREWAKILSSAGLIPNNKLDSLCEYYKLPRSQAHGALEDARLSCLAAKAIRQDFLEGTTARRASAQAEAKEQRAEGGEL